MSPRRSPLAPLLLVLLAPLAAPLAGPLGAQAPACRDTLSGASLTRVRVFLEPSLPDSAARAAFPTAQQLADATAERVRAALGAAAGQLPDADARLDWRQLGGGVTVVLKRGAPLAVRPDADATPAVALLRRAVRDAETASGPFFWDDAVPGDSLRIVLAYRRPQVWLGGGTVEMRTAFAAPVFTLPVPAESEPQDLQRAAPQYPAVALSSTAYGSVTLAFDVDTTGKVDPASVADVWPDGRPRPAGDLLAHYRAFVNEARRALLKSVFLPARVGGCVERRRTHRQFTFTIREHGA
ncbi:hypothetical protein [Roseisolibacter sp. H3M3-2]|uniref:hypothetical protein n=1 Tax=Roseisolibacter sp. H3M3-2 TaxID=3031323 RepID=UPI0023DB34A8|nr:hypothetical protein [Roseisolibacter sp. H3M3-2]MDF1502610.1 hypothetical protein [Roseisolibacter sp. H3M3-2]